jgi:hypothetical protein
VEHNNYLTRFMIVAGVCIAMRGVQCAVIVRASVVQVESLSGLRDEPNFDDSLAIGERAHGGVPR